ncbi:MAG: LPP20 family lipoprotein [Elusimicrobiota bacterium]
MKSPLRGFALLLLPAALLAAPAKPDWLSGDSSSYPKSAYILGIGEGPTQEKAGDRARAEIAKVFGVELTAKSIINESASTDAAGSSESQYVSNDVRTSTAKFMENVEAVQYWTDESGAVHALAALNRAHALTTLGDRIAEIDRDFEANSADLDKAEGKFAAMRAALKLQSGAKIRRRLNEDYRILNPDGKGIPAAEDAHEVLTRARRAVSALTVSVTGAGASAGRLRSRMVDALEHYGLKAVESGQAPDVLIEISGAARPLPIENLTWFLARGTVSVKMSYGSTGEVFKRFDESGEGSSGDPADSVPAALTILTDRAAVHAYQVLTSPTTLDD